MSDLAAALLRGVFRHYHANGDRIMLAETEVLAALSAALDPALTARAGEVLEGVTPGPWETVFDRQTWGWLEVDGPSFKIGAPTRATDLSLADEVQRKKDARFIAWCREGVPALLAQIAALRAERDHWHDGWHRAMGEFDRKCKEANEQRARAEAAEAEVEKLRGAGDGLHSIVEGIQGAMQHGTWRDEKGQRLKDTPEWVAFYNARAALTTEERHEG